MTDYTLAFVDIRPNDEARLETADLNHAKGAFEAQFALGLAETVACECKFFRLDESPANSGLHHLDGPR